MKIVPRERALRTLLAAFLRSDLTTREIKALLHELHGPDFTFVFRDLLEEVLERVSSNRTPKMQGRRDNIRPDRAETAYYTIQRKRMGKRDVLELMNMSAPQVKVDSTWFDLPVREILLRFFAAADEQSATRFLQALAGPVKDDPYLRGIMKKR